MKNLINEINDVFSKNDKTQGIIIDHNTKFSDILINLALLEPEQIKSISKSFMENIN